MLNVKQSIKTGISFGLTSSVITTLGLMIGLYFGTQSRLAVIGGIITIALADAMSDGLGIHVSEEARATSTRRAIWEATLSTFLIKFLFTLTFLIPIVIFSLKVAVIVSVLWGYVILGLLTFMLGSKNTKDRLKMVLEHISIMTLVIFLSYLLGLFVNRFFS